MELFPESHISSSFNELTFRGWHPWTNISFMKSEMWTNIDLFIDKQQYNYIFVNMRNCFCIRHIFFAETFANLNWIYPPFYSNFYSLISQIMRITNFTVLSKRGQRLGSDRVYLWSNLFLKGFYNKLYLSFSKDSCEGSKLKWELLSRGGRKLVILRVPEIRTACWIYRRVTPWKNWLSA